MDPHSASRIPPQETPCVSVLMSVYNGERHLCEAIDSILNQTFRDFEFIIIDDGSTDGTAAILDRYIDARIRRIRNEQNIGLTRSLNIGLAACRGEFIARMDADDVSLPDRLRMQVAFLDSHLDVGIVGSFCRQIDSSGRELGVVTVPEDNLDIQWTSIVNNPFLHPTVMFRRDVLVQHGLMYDERLLPHLPGMFAFALWDERQQTLLCARDRLGEKPLYYAWSDQGHFLVASELKALLASGLIRPKLDQGSVEAYLALLYVPPDRTIYSNVHVLRPGHALEWQGGRIRTWAYWQPTFQPKVSPDPREAVGEVARLLGQAVKRQMVADVTVGAFLSGGLDSSTIVSLMAEQSSGPIKTFAVGFGDLIDELPYARVVAERCKTDHHEIQMAIPVGELLERMADVYDEPFADSSNIPTYLLAGFARRHVKVVLSGDGGDELFGGYDWYRPLLEAERLRPSEAAVVLLRLQAAFWRLVVGTGLLGFRLREEARQMLATAQHRSKQSNIWENHLGRMAPFGRWDELLGPRPERQEAQSNLRAVYRPGVRTHGLDQATDFDVRCYLPGDILVKVDRAAMAHGLETRAPFLDMDLVNFVLGLGWSTRFTGEASKPLLRTAFAGRWPESVQRRAKQGFGAPIWEWVKRPDVQSLLQRVCARGSPLVALLPDVGSLSASCDLQQMWSILCLGLWLEKRQECL